MKFLLVSVTYGDLFSYDTSKSKKGLWEEGRRTFSELTLKCPVS